MQPPGPNYPLGTDDVGRDVLTRLLYAGRVSLSVGFLVALVSLGTRRAAGAAGGLLRRAGGRPGQCVRAVLLNIPALFVLIVLSIFLTPNVVQLALIFGLFFWPSTARQVRAVVLSARNRDYVDAARVLGCPRRADHGASHPAERGVSGLVVAGTGYGHGHPGGVQPEFSRLWRTGAASSWGNMLSVSQEMFRSAPWLVYPPGIMIFVTVLCVFLVSDGLRDALDPRLVR